MKIKSIFLTIGVMGVVLGLTTFVSSEGQAEGRLRERIKERLAERRAENGSGDSSSETGLLDGGRSGLRERLSERRGHDSGSGEGDSSFGGISCEKLTNLVNKKKETVPPSESDAEFPDLAYGSDPLQKIDVYRADAKECPATEEPLPIIVMVHGGAWCIGDKSVGKVVDNKSARWTPKGFLFISVNNRMIPDGADPLTQARDVANAMGYIQKHAKEWNGDPTKIILMGHSAGAHLVSLVSASYELKAQAGLKPWLGTISLDSAVLNVPETMKAKHYSFYDDAFGTDENYWIRTSPYHQAKSGMPKWLGVCGTRRKDSCPQAHAFATKTGGQVLEQDLNHGEINELLGTPGAYTEAVEAFMSSLDPVVRHHLASGAGGTR